MKILLTGATGYIGKRLLPVLINNGHDVVCCVRDIKRFNPPEKLKVKLTVVKVDLLKNETFKHIPKDIGAAYYLVHSMSNSKSYEDLEKESAINFREALNKTNVKQVIFLSGIINEGELSQHLNSRRNVENELKQGKFNLTTLRAGIIIGSGSSSFEIIRDLVEKLPVMVTPKWLNTKSQPIAVKDVIQYLSKTLFKEETFNRDYDIGGKEILSYKNMLLEFAKQRGLKRRILILPVMTPRLSSYWLYFVTSVSYKLAIALVNSMKIEVICRKNNLDSLLNIKPISYKEALQRAFKKVETNEIISSWKDAFSSGRIDRSISDSIQVPTHGCFIDHRTSKFISREKCIEKIWSIGGKNGWYCANTLWKIRGFLDKLVGGVGLRRGRTNANSIQPGDALDFWRVLYADKSEGRLLLFAEMRLPGEAWLEFKINKNVLIQTATFRPLGIAGRMYWYSIKPFHNLIFKGMVKKITIDNN